MTDDIKQILAGPSIEVQRKLKRRAQNQAQKISIRSRHAIVSIKLLEVLNQFFDLLYQKDQHGYVNFDPVNLMIKIPVPWSGKNYIKYGLTRTEADILRKIIATLPVPSPLIYGEDNRRWHLNIMDFPDQRSVAEYILNQKINYETVHGAIKEINDGKQPSAVP